MTKGGVEGHHGCSAGRRQPDQKSIVDLVMPMTSREQFVQSRKPRAPRLKKYVIRTIDQPTKHMTGFSWRFGTGNDCGIARNADESSLSQQAGGPTVAFTSSKTHDRALMEGMMRPSEGQQDICVQQKQFHSSSQARRTALSEIMGVPGRSSKVGKRFPPLGVVPCGIWTARRIKSEMTFPKRLPEVLESVTAVSYASSSRVTVVLMILIQ
jgi:hypothetical protein